jgi:hypothetical protein
MKKPADGRTGLVIEGKSLPRYELWRLDSADSLYQKIASADDPAELAKVKRRLDWRYRVVDRRPAPAKM